MSRAGSPAAGMMAGMDTPPPDLPVPELPTPDEVRRAAAVLRAALAATADAARTDPRLADPKARATTRAAGESLGRSAAIIDHILPQLLALLPRTPGRLNLD